MRKLILFLTFLFVPLVVFAAVSTNYVIKSGGGTKLVNSPMYATSTAVGIGSTSPRGRLDVGTGYIYGNGTTLTGVVPTTRKINGQALTSDITISGGTDGGVDMSLYAPKANPVFTGVITGNGAGITGLVPTTRTVNGKALTSDITIAASDLNLTAYAPLASPTFTGTVAGITKAMVGLNAVSNAAQVTAVTATSPLTASAGTTPNLTIDLSLYSKLAAPHFTGNVGIGSTTPRGSLDVAGEIYGTKSTIAGTGSRITGARGYVDFNDNAGVTVETQIYNAGMPLIDGGSNVCFNRTTKSFYVKTTCP